jgi:hypothetical protein
MPTRRRGAIRLLVQWQGRVSPVRRDRLDETSCAQHGPPIRLQPRVRSWSLGRDVRGPQPKHPEHVGPLESNRRRGWSHPHNPIAAQISPDGLPQCRSAPQSPAEAALQAKKPSRPASVNYRPSFTWPSPISPPAATGRSRDSRQRSSSGWPSSSSDSASGESAGACAERPSGFEPSWSA